MNSPAVKVSAPSPQPALELIALAQLSPDMARQRLRALLLANPNYFEKIPPTSFSAVLNIEEDTTYESISRLGYDPEIDQLSVAIDVKQPAGYSSEVLFQGSEEFVRFYMSYDGGANWDDLGMRSITVADAHRPRPLAYEVALHNISSGQLIPKSGLPRIRAILSWSTPPPAGEPSWIPVWGHIAESDVHMEDLRMLDSMRSKTPVRVDRLESVPNVISANMPMAFTSAGTPGLLSMRALHSTRTDPHHRFLAYAFARAAGHCPPSLSGSRTAEPYPVQGAVLAPALSVAIAAGIS
jgi:hypothetical protein